MPCNPFVRAKWREAWTHREPERDKPALPWGTVGPAPKVHILDRKDFDGGIVADVEDAMRFIERNTRTAYRIEGLRRQNVPEYPMEAVREAITNAVMHHDWFFDGANVEPSTRAAPTSEANKGGVQASLFDVYEGSEGHRQGLQDNPPSAVRTGRRDHPEAEDARDRGLEQRANGGFPGLGARPRRRRCRPRLPGCASDPA